MERRGVSNEQRHGRGLPVEFFLQAPAMARVGSP